LSPGLPAELRCFSKLASKAPRVFGHAKDAVAL
jgi:hypothetical protein